ncbi:putative aldo/keto reductase [Hypomontagnella monticulosa]|nr:putative aldo/keto reductase [Hypomontagnella monticulosa]
MASPVTVTSLMTVAPKPKSLLGYHRQLAPNAAIKVSPLCLGAMGFGVNFKEILGACDKEASFKLLDFFYENGGNFIDTASGYQHGESEIILGEWMKERGNRDEIVLATKYTSAFQLGNSEIKIQSNFGGNNKKSMLTAITSSLKRLHTTYIDLFYVHSWDFTTSIPELMHALNDLVTSGKVLYLGISNTPAWIVSMANEYARQKGLTAFSVFQGLWSAAERDIEREILPMCNNQGMGVVPYGVLGSGFFRTSAQRAAERQETEKREGRNIGFMDKPQKTVMADTLEKIAIAKGTSITSVALAWVRTKGPYVVPVVGGRKIEHLKASIEALGLQLTEEEIKEIENAVPFDFGYPQALLGGPGGATHPGDLWMTKRFGHFDWVEAPKPPKQRSN